MENYQPDRVVRGLTLLLSFVYYATWVLGAVVLVGTVGMRLFGAGDDWSIGLPVRAGMASGDAVVSMDWGTARLAVDDVSASLRLPIATIPWVLFAVLWLYTAAGFAYLLIILGHLRRIFRRVRAGAPFDAENARRLRLVGLLLVVAWPVVAVVEFMTSQAVGRGLQPGALTIPSGLNLEWPTLIPGLLLMALAEIFRRGAQLEHEQSLVI